MRLSRYSDYALRVLMQAALRHPQRVTVDEVAATFGISRHHLVKVVHDLGRSGYLQTQRGAGGGFTLASPPARIRLGDIVRLGEEAETVIECTEGQGQPCRLRPACRLKGVLDEAAAAFFGVLDGYSVADLVKQPAKMRAVLELLPGPIPAPGPSGSGSVTPEDWPEPASPVCYLRELGEAPPAPRTPPGEVRLKRAYEAPSPEDGCRFLVDRLWPRGVSKDTLALTAWLKEVAPSDALRHWFGHEVSRWETFCRRYTQELTSRPEALRPLREALARGPVTLVYAARDPDHNQAVVLREVLRQAGPWC